MKVAMVTSHPIQYQVPVFRCLHAMTDVDFTALFAMVPDAAQQGSGFGLEFEWDVPLLGGYRYEILKNIAAKPSVTRFSGCDTPGVYDVLKSLRPDAVIVNGWVVKSCVQALWACKRLRIPCLVRGEANNLRARPAWKRLLQRLLVQRYSGCLCIGKENREFYASLGVDGDHLFSAPYCVDNERFERVAARMRASRPTIRARWQIPADAACFLFCGKFEDKKHPLELLDAFASAQSARAGLHLLMVGDGVLRAQCEEFARERQLPVTFAGFLNQSEIVAAYLAADCLVLPSDAGETWGLVVNEAMACGLPAIVSDRVGCRSDLIEAGVTGDVFSFGEWDELVLLLRRYGADSTRMTGMGTAARALVREYSPQHAAVGIRDAVTAVTRCGQEMQGT